MRGVRYGIIALVLLCALVGHGSAVTRVGVRRAVRSRAPASEAVPSSDERDFSGSYESAMSLLRDATESREDRADRLREEMAAERETREQALRTLLSNADAKVSDQGADPTAESYRGTSFDLDAIGARRQPGQPQPTLKRVSAAAAVAQTLQPSAHPSTAATGSRKLAQQGNPITPPPQRPSGAQGQTQEPTEPEAPIIYPIDAPGDKKTAAPTGTAKTAPKAQGGGQPQRPPTTQAPTEPEVPIIYPIDAPGDKKTAKAAPKSRAAVPVSAPSPAPSVGQPQAPAPAPTPPIPYPIDMGSGGNAKPPASSQSAPAVNGNSGSSPSSQPTEQQAGSPAPAPKPAPTPAPTASPKPAPIIYPIDAGKGQSQSPAPGTASPAPAQQQQSQATLAANTLLSRAETALTGAWEGAKRAANSVWDGLTSAWKSVTSSVNHVFDHFRDHEQALQEAREAEIQAKRQALSQQTAKFPQPAAAVDQPAHQPADPALVVAHSAPSESPAAHAHAASRFRSSHTAAAVKSTSSVAGPIAVSDDVSEQRRSVESMTDRITAVLRKLRLHAKEPSPAHDADGVAEVHRSAVPAHRTASTLHAREVHAARDEEYDGDVEQAVDAEQATASHGRQRGDDYDVDAQADQQSATSDSDSDSDNDIDSESNAAEDSIDSENSIDASSDAASEPSEVVESSSPSDDATDA